ncbi:hypothetical protein ENSA5_62820 [Enhygromyxa salina]|uniref:Uncharacterized protein n=1 Tax=Enhygromyxa salina TaxID=215803 RepID=A0A2S9XCS9_9BACT|nr:hypothetical protein ENSA5_62820 [Enhygromyxa salina]
MTGAVGCSSLTSASQREDCTLCNPYNNECYATKMAEMWDPSCPDAGWAELGEQESPRMYHSTALLLPDGRVLSMGGGHRDFSRCPPSTPEGRALRGQWSFS